MAAQSYPPESDPVATALVEALDARVEALEEGGGVVEETDPVAGPALASHIGDTAGAHAASAVSVAAPLTEGNAQAELERLSLAVEMSSAEDVAFTPAGPIAATDVQAAIVEVAADAIPLTQRAAANGVATLGADSKVPSTQLPAIAITSVSVVASQVAQLALTAQEGDVAVRSDLVKSYVHNGGSAGTMADWTELQTPTDLVLSVAGRTGAVTLTKTDVGLPNVDNTADTAKPVSTAQAAAITAATPDASKTVKGLARVSHAPVAAGTPIAVGDNDLRLIDNPFAGFSPFTDRNPWIWNGSGTPTYVTTIATRTTTVGITNASAALTGTDFSALDVGHPISGTGIPALATILSVTNATTATLSTNATATDAALSATITGDLTKTFRHRARVLRTASGVRLLFPNWEQGGKPTGNAITVSALIENGQNTAGSTAVASYSPIPVTFDGGSSYTKAIQSGGFAISDPLCLDYTTAEYVWTRVSVSVATVGHKFPLNTFYNVAGEGELYGDKTQAATALTYLNVGLGAIYGAWALTPSERGSLGTGVFALADSIGTDYNLSTYIDGGIIQRGLLSTPNKVASICSAISGQRIDQFLASDTLGRSLPQMSKHYRGAIIAAGGRWFINQVGINDIEGLGVAASGYTYGSPATLAVMKTRIQALAAMAHQRGMKFAQQTYGPVSTGAWTSAGAQTTSANNTVRAALNAWILLGGDAGEIDLAIDVAALLETSVGSGIWVSPSGVAQTADGLHPNLAGILLGAAAYQTATAALI